MSRIDKSVTVTAGQNAQVAAHADHVIQTQAAGVVDVQKLRSAADAALEALPALGLTGEQRAETERVAREIIAEADGPAPDHGRLRGLAGTLKEWLGLATQGATLVGMVVGDIHSALG